MYVNVPHKASRRGRGEEYLVANGAAAQGIEDSVQGRGLHDFAGGRDGPVGAEGVHGGRLAAAVLCACPFSGSLVPLESRRCR